MRGAYPCHIRLNSVSQEKLLASFLVLVSGRGKLVRVANLPGIVKDGAKFDSTFVKGHAKGMEFRDKLVGSLKNKLGMPDEAVRRLKIMKQLEGVASFLEHQSLPGQSFAGGPHWPCCSPALAPEEKRKNGARSFIRRSEPGPALDESAEAGFFYGLAEVFAGHFYADAHFCQAGAHAVADAVAQ